MAAALTRTAWLLRFAISVLALGGLAIVASAGFMQRGTVSGQQASAQATHRIIVPALARDGAIPSRPEDFDTGAMATVTPASVTLVATVTAKNAERMIVDIEVYAPGGARIHQQPYYDEVFKPGQTRTFQVQFSLGSSPAAGTYVVKVGLFSADWVDLYHWNNEAAVFEQP